MDTFKVLMVGAVIGLAVYWIRYFWLLTHRISVRIDGKKPHFSKLERVVRFIEQEFDKTMSDQHGVNPINEEEGCLTIEITNEEGGVIHEFIFTGPSEQISSLVKSVRSSETYRGMTGQISD